MTGDQQPTDPTTNLNLRLDVDLALEAAGLGVWEYDPVTGQTNWDDRCRALYGLDKGNNSTYEQAFQYIHPDDADLVEEAVTKVLTPPTDGRYDVTFRTIGGDDRKLRWVRFQGKAQFTAAGEVQRFGGVAFEVTAQVTTQQALFESQAHLQLLRDTVPAMIFYLDLEQRYQSYNEVFRDWFGVEGDQAIGKTVQEFLGEEAYHQTQPHLAKAYSGQAERYELYAPSRMSTDRWLSVVYTPHKTPDGNVTGVIVHATDSTPSKLVELELRASEARFRTLIEEAPVATCLFVGPAMRIELANQAMIQVWGKGPDVVGLPLAEALPELKNQHFLTTLDALFTTGNTYEAKGGRADLVIAGKLQTFYFNYNFKPLRTPEGEVYAILETATDVTQQVLTRQKLEEAESGLRGAVELAQLGTWSIDVATGGLTYSDRLIEWFGYDPAAQDYTQVIPILSAADQERVTVAVARALLPESEGIYEETYTVIHPKTGQKRVLHAHGKTVFDASGKAIRLNGTAQDITLQQELQLALEHQVQERTEELAAANEEMAATNEELAAINEELEAHNEEYAAINEELQEANFLLSRSNDNLQQFAYVASHDLQEPLRKIQQFGDLLKTRYTTPLGEELTYIERMQSAAARMSGLIKDLLSYSRITSQRDIRASVPLNQVVDDVLTDLDLLRTETQARIEVAPLPVVEGDAGQLGQLFQNLLSNALKFRRPDVAPQIHINSNRVSADQLPTGVKPARSAQAYHQIEVIDNGIGFEEKYVDRIFQVFQRLHGKSAYAGTGIGLAICEKVVANHGGAITAHSQVGQGATFSVYLPV